MISRLDPSSEAFLAAVNRINDQAQRATRQISSGIRISVASDAPEDLSTLLRSRAELDQTTQIGDNLGRVKSEVDTAEQTVSNAAKLMDRVITLAAQGATGTQSAETRASMAGEVDGIFQQMVGISTTTMGGRYLFSGDADSTAPYAWDSTAAYPVAGYYGADATRKISDSAGVTFRVSLSAQQIFDDMNDSVFHALWDLSQGLHNNDATAISSALGEVKDAGDHLNRQLAFYGTVQNQVSRAVDDASAKELRLKSDVASLQETDATEAILELTQANIHLQAALESRARLPRTSLFDFLA